MKRREMPVTLLFATTFLTVGIFVTALTIISVVALLLLHDNNDRIIK
jgi:hypothetical protein